MWKIEAIPIHDPGWTKKDKDSAFEQEEVESHSRMDCLIMPHTLFTLLPLQNIPCYCTHKPALLHREYSDKLQIIWKLELIDKNEMHELLLQSYSDPLGIPFTDGFSDTIL